MPLRSTRSAFSLVELLVVITIVALLVAMMLPAMGRAKREAQRTLCLGRERQIGVGMANYLASNGLFYPYAASYESSTPGYTVERSWDLCLSPFLGGYSANQRVPLLVCPANPWNYACPEAGGNRVNPPTTYGMSTAFPDSPVVTRTTPRSELQTLQIKDSSLKQPSGILLMGEQPLGYASEFSRTFYEGQALSCVPFYPNAAYYSQQPGGYGYGDSFAGRATAGHPQAMTIHYLGSEVSWNSLMADGAARTTTKKELQRLTVAVYTGSGYEGLKFWQGK